MRLTVLGGSAAGPNTGQGCSGYLVETATTRLVLDLGPGTLPELRRHTDFRTLSAIVVSHLHLDHLLDLLALRFALAYNPIRPPGPIPLWMPPGGSAFLQSAAIAFAEPGQGDDFFSSVFAVEEYDPDNGLTVGDAQLRFRPTVHSIPCWAIRLSGPDGGDLVYTADTGPAAPLAVFAHGAAVLVAEATTIDPSAAPVAERIHLSAGEAGALAHDAAVQRLVLTHLWEERDFEAYRREAASHFFGPLELARPGLRVSWS